MLNCLCCLRVGGEKDRGGLSPEAGAPARESHCCPARKEKPQGGYCWGTNVGVKCWPNVGTSTKSRYHLLRLAMCQALR